MSSDETKRITTALRVKVRYPDVDTFVDNIFNFPTLAEAFQVAASEIVERRSAVRKTALRSACGSVAPAMS